jgi:hypothetical protein
MTIDLRTLALALAVLATASAAAQTPSPPDTKAAAKEQQVKRAKERCRLNRGVDCDTAEGLKEWLLYERSRDEAIREGSRHLLPAQPKPAPSRP